MKPHTCKRPNHCTCSLIGSEPDENCNVHGYGEWPPRCGICGKFMPYDIKIYQESEDTLQGLLKDK